MSFVFLMPYFFILYPLAVTCFTICKAACKLAKTFHYNVIKSWRVNPEATLLQDAKGQTTVWPVRLHTIWEAKDTLARWTKWMNQRTKELTKEAISVSTHSQKKKSQLVVRNQPPYTLWLPIETIETAARRKLGGSRENCKTSFKNLQKH